MSERPVYVFDATPLIHFAKIRKLDLVLGTCDALMTREVYKESVEHGRGKPDATLIQEAVQREQIKVYDVKDRNAVRMLQKYTEIHLGEAETLSAARELDAYAVIDEAEARTIAKTYGIKTRMGTLFLLFRLLALHKIGTRECEQILDELVESGLYIDSQTLVRAKQKLRANRQNRESSPR